MAYLGRKAKKPGSVPGAASGGAEEEKVARLRSIGRQLARGRTERNLRSTRGERGTR